MKALFILWLLGVAAVSANSLGRGIIPRDDIDSNDLRNMRRCFGDKFVGMVSAATEKCSEVGVPGPPSWEDFEDLQEMLHHLLDGDRDEQNELIVDYVLSHEFGSEMEITEEDFIGKLEMLQNAMMTLTGNVTCFWREMNWLDAQGNLHPPDVLLEVFDDYGIEDGWVAEKTKLVAGPCQKSAMALPKDYHDLFQLDEKLARLMSFDTCITESSHRICKNMNIRRWLEAYFGPVSKLVEKTGLEEGELLSLAGSII